MANEFQIQLKVERAKQHVRDLDSATRQFLDSKPYIVGTKRNPQTRQLIYYVVSVKPIPSHLTLIAGDVIQNLVSALDHLAYQLVLKDTKGVPPKPKKIYFPIFESSTEYEARKCGKIEGAGKDTFDAIDKIKPYKGGNDDLWILHRLNNIEKHRLLLTVGSATSGMNIGQYLANFMSKNTPVVAPGAWESMNLFLAPEDTGFPLEAGFELFIDAVDAEPDPNQQFGFTIALDEPGVIDGKPLLPTMETFLTVVENVFNDLAPLLK